MRSNTPEGLGSTRRNPLPALFLVAVLAACEAAAPAATTPSSSRTPPTPTPSIAPSLATEWKVAYIRDLSPEGAVAATTPAQQAVELAFAAASLRGGEPLAVEVVAFDTQGDAALAAEIANEVAADPAFVGAIAGPDLSGQAALGETLGRAGVPVLSLSGRDSASDAAPGTWLRLVAPVEAQAIALARTATSLKHARLGICLVAGPADGSVFARTVARSIAVSVDAIDVADMDDIEAAGCRVVAWTGDAEGGARLAAALIDFEAPPWLIGGATLRDPVFLEEAGLGAEGAWSLCSCADVSTSLELAAQRFIQDFQSEYGSPPGPYAVEAWDGAHLLLRGLRETEGRQALADWLAGTTVFEGLGGTYSLREGELADPAASMRAYRVDGGRWILSTIPGRR